MSVLTHVPQTRYLLALNTAEGFLQVVLGRYTDAQAETLPPVTEAFDEYPIFPEHPVSLVCAQEWRLPSQGAELLTPLLEGMLARVQAHITDVYKIACVTGPGSFTGIRLALVSAAALSRTAGALQGGMPYMPLLALNTIRLAPWLFTSTAELPWLWLLTHARRNLVHIQAFSISLPQDRSQAPPSMPNPIPPQLRHAFLKPMTRVLVMAPEDAVACIKAHNAPSVIAGSGLAKNVHAFEEFFYGSPGAPQHHLLHTAPFSSPLPQVLLDMAAGIPYSQKDLTPEYVRPSDAEENLASIAVSLGLDPIKAQDILESLTTQPMASRRDI